MRDVRDKRQQGLIQQLLGHQNYTMTMQIGRGVHVGGPSLRQREEEKSYTTL